MNQQPKIQVGIIACEEIKFRLSGNFLFQDNSHLIQGEYLATLKGDQIMLKYGSGDTFYNDTFIIKPDSLDSFFELNDVVIGVNFHWEQKENQQFKGALKLIADNGKVLAINEIALEDYLKSVISSEMSASASPHLLKAHAVISRSWLLAQIEKTKSIKSGGGLYQTSFESEKEIIRWYDREDHSLFDVCADDHCQRYQGITKIFSDKAIKAVEETFGEVLVFDNQICDARFSKCCGGISESFENAWEPQKFSYLTAVRDAKNTENTVCDLMTEQEAEDWIKCAPFAFCNTDNKQILSQVLPGFDQKTTDFYRWKIEYTQSELAGLIKERSGIDFGEIISLKPVERGFSARIIKLKITGTKRTLIVGKELEIRKWLSKSHLYSSAFVIDHLDQENGIPHKFVLTGAGWGHGVGLCQIGAAVMGEKGYTYKEILNHYFRGAQLKKLYR